MQPDIAHLVKTGLFVGILFVGMLSALEFGRRLGRRRLARDPEGARSGSGAVEASVFGLLGLLIAFTFNGAASRFDERRVLIVEEVNAVGTAWMRLEMLADPARQQLQELFRAYLDSRIETYRKLPDLEACQAELRRTSELQNRIWAAATAACKTEDGRSLTMLLLPPLNQMFDIVSTRTAAAQRHPPSIIFILLLVLSLSCALLAGYGMASARERSLTHMLGFALITAMAVYVITDLEYPRRGFIRVDSSDQLLIDLRQTMDPPAGPR
jgi:hypothetical protein